MPEHSMGNLPSIKAAELNPSARQRVANLLHVDLTDSDELIVTLRRAVQTPADGQREAARERLLQYLNRLDERLPDVPEEEMEAAIDEAMQFIRPRR
jgi:hypothetical protein